MASFSQEHDSRNTPDPIAIVGAGCRLPGNITTIAGLLSALRDGRDCITEVPTDRWQLEEFYDPDPVAQGKTYVRHGGFMDEIDRFDAGFFGISDAEASRMDPQQRIVLQTVWHALEHAGQSASELHQSNTGVFLAMMNTNGYAQLKGMFEGFNGVTAYDAMGDAMSITAGRISHFLGLEGPCVALDTACSGSMVALHLARQSILAGDCDTAIVAGVSAILHPGIHIAFSKVGLMSRAGRCAAFDASADGYIRGEGCMVVILRRQSLAMARGDRIMASIVGTAVNQDGRTPALTAPNGRAQEKVIRNALARVGVSPTEIGYVEAHGTGTPVGDPIEMSAIANVFGPGRKRDNPLYVGSVKSNFGHIEAGAGLLGLIKAALSLDQELIMPSLHFTRLNPNIDLGLAPVRVPTTTLPWPRGARPRLAGVNSFGYSGTNAHAILQEAPLSPNGNQAAEEVERVAARPFEMLVLSTKNAGSLQELADKWSDYLAQDDPTPLRDIAFTAATGRTHLKHRLALVGRSRYEIHQKLQAWRDGRMPKGVAAGQQPSRSPKIGFIFTGQGAQYADMGRQLAEMEPQFAQALDRCAAVMDEALGVPIRDVLFGSESANYLANTRYVQPALFAFEYALAELLRHWGVEPDFVIGHSVGEIVAACIAGVLTLEDAVTFIVARGRLMGALPMGGKMLALATTQEQAHAWTQGLEDEVSVATVNGPRSVVVSGTAAAVEAVSQLAQAAGVRSRELTVSHAFHSPLMDPILGELEAVAASMQISSPRIPFISNVSGRLHHDAIPAEYWSTHVRQAVLFHEGVNTMIEAGANLLIEVGPHPALTPAVATAFDVETAPCIPTLRRDRQDFSHILRTLATLFTKGVPLQLDRLFWSPAYRLVSLPHYPFRRNRHWLPADLGAEPSPQAKVDLHPLLGEAITISPRRVIFETNLAASPPWTDHRVLGSTVFPGTGYLELAARGFAAAAGKTWRAVVLRKVTFERPLLLTYGKPKKVRLTLSGLSSSGSGDVKFAIEAADKDSLTYCRGVMTTAAAAVERIDMETVLSGRDTSLEIGPFYGDMRKSGLEYGAGFANVRELWLGKPGSGEAYGRVATLPMSSDGDNPYQNAVLLDGCLQVFGAALRTFDGSGYQGAYVPASIESMMIKRQLPAQVWSQVSMRTSDNGRAALVDIRVFSDEGEIVATISGLELRQKMDLNPIAQRPNDASNGSQITVDDSGIRYQSRAQLVADLTGLNRRERVRKLSKWLATEVKDTLGQAAESLDLDEIEPSTAFMEIGLDSLLVTELQRRIQEKLDFRFQPMQGLDYQSIESLAEFILDEVLIAEADSQPK